MQPREDFTVVRNHFNLQTFQRRLRHLQSIAVRNLHCPRNQEIDLSQFSVYFTLHKDEKHRAFYTSEKITGSLNPTWQSFFLSGKDTYVDLTSKFVVVRVWCCYGKAARVKIEAHVHLSGLVYLANRLQAPGVKHQQNTLLFGMFNHFFIHYNPSTAVQHLEQWIPDHEVPRDPYPAMVKVDPSILRKSYDKNYLLRIHMVQRAIRQTQVSVQKIHSSIEDRLLSSSENSDKLSQREVLLMKVRQLRQELLWQTQQKQAEQESLEKFRGQQDCRLNTLKERRLHLQNLAKDIEEKRTMHIQSREMLVKENAQVLFRRKQIISEMVHYVYPITEDEKHNFYICNVKLPNAEDYQGQDEQRLSIGLGFTCHLTQMVSHFMDMPLRYPMVHRGSRSTIIDHIHSKLTEKDREFPLFGKGKEKFQYNYAVFLLNKNISQLRFYCGLGTNDLRQTLPNLKSLFEQRLGVRSISTPEQQQGALAALQSPHTTSLGGSQASRKSQALSSNASSYNRKDLTTNQDSASQPMLRSSSASFPLVEGIGLSNLEINPSLESEALSTPGYVKPLSIDRENVNHSNQKAAEPNPNHSRNGHSYNGQNSENFSKPVFASATQEQNKNAITEEDETEDLFKPSDDSFFKVGNSSSMSAFNQLLKASENDSDAISSALGKELATNGVIPNSDIYHENPQASFKLLKTSAPITAPTANLSGQTESTSDSWPPVSPNSPLGFRTDMASWGSGAETLSQSTSINNEADTGSYNHSSSYNDSEMDASEEKNGERPKV